MSVLDGFKFAIGKALAGFVITFSILSLMILAAFIWTFFEDRREKKLRKRR